MRVPIKQLKERFEQIRKTHVKRYEAANRGNRMPDVEVVLSEYREGKLSLDEVALVALLERRSCWIEAVDLLSSPSIETWKSAEEKRSKDERRFLDALESAQRSYMDRVLFDGESGFLMLRDFENWSFEVKEGAC